MKEILRCNDPVLLSFVRATLDAEGVRYMVVDGNMSVLEGSLGVLAARVLAADADEARARQALADAGLAHELRPEAP